MTMPPHLRKFMLAVHLASSVGWIGAAAAYLTLVVVVLANQDARTVRDAILVMQVIDWFVIIPLALAALLTGLVMSLGTPWGLFRHYWVLISLVLTILSTVVLLLHMPTVSSLAGMARQTDGARLGAFG